ncbi:MAG: hypothetical protein ABSC04_10095 [Syntrophobacteraceae bacterium]
MKRLSKLFRSGSTDVTNVDMRRIHELMNQIDEATKKIFNFNAIELLNEPLSNVVAAVWGTLIDKSQPTSTQRQIDSTIRPIIRTIQDALKTEELTGAKDCVIDYLIRRLAVSEILFMITCYKLNMLTNEQSKSMDIYNLADIHVTGHA